MCIIGNLTIYLKNILYIAAEHLLNTQLASRCCGLNFRDLLNLWFGDIVHEHEHIYLVNEHTFKVQVRILFCL